MASAVIASRNETNWGEFMGKIPFSNNQPRRMNPNPNPISKHKSSKKKHFSNGRQDDFSAVVAPAASDDAYSYNQRPAESTSREFVTYVSYNVSSYSARELKDLRRKLASELESIRSLKDRIDSGSLSRRSDVSESKNKKLVGSKRSFAPVVADNVEANESLMKMCRQVLTKLMKHKQSWIFKTPVDAVALGLHDYHQIVKRPMDLGTVKSNLSKNLYRTPSEFADDVRLTFNNAMLYNPKTDDVHGIADLLLTQFEEMFRPVEEKIGRSRVSSVDELQGSSRNDVRSPERPKDRPKKVKNSPPVLPPPPPPQPPVMSNPVPPPPPPVEPPEAPSPMPTHSVKAPKLPKPRAKDPDKREMSMEEKQKLGLGLQSLPQEKMPQLVHIIRKRNAHLAQEGDEIELDIEALDTETLWELDRFVTNWKKFVSKTKRQALLVPNVGVPGSSVDMDEDNVIERQDNVKKARRDVGEEDVDIGDEMPESSFPPVEIEKDEGGGGGGGGQGNEAARGHPNGNAPSSSSSSSGSSSSGSSSSSDSDSGSSSGSDSDADDAQS